MTAGALTIELVGIRVIDGRRMAVYSAHVFETPSGPLLMVPWSRYVYLGKPRTLTLNYAVSE